MKVLVAPDSFKGSASASDAARAVAAGWRSARPHDTVIELPQADGGEGTLDAIAAAGSWRSHRERVTGPDRRPVYARWMRNDNGSAVVELAESSGITLMPVLSPVTATSRGTGEVLARVLDSGVHDVLIALGGSASTDGGFGLLCALGLRAFDSRGRLLEHTTVGALDAVATVDATELRPAPAGGVVALVDTTAPLFGPRGAAHVFGPQKGAGSAVLRYLDDRLRHWSDVLAAAGLTADPGAPGAGAAGGGGYALLCWGAGFASGADHVVRRSGLGDRIPSADLVVTGEGRFDATSLTGKLVGRVLQKCEAAGTPAVVIAGQIATDTPGHAVSLADLAGTVDAALADPLRWLREAGAAAAHREC
ncbi:MAG: glycerate kinase [Mycobacterium kyogaense]|uniref:glycerate kinase n=1 Tax=Mycobacterium kyogaense TaxID=2212479 RepID=UPI002FF5F8EC